MSALLMDLLLGPSMRSYKMVISCLGGFSSGTTASFKVMVESVDALELFLFFMSMLPLLLLLELFTADKRIDLKKGEVLLLLGEVE